MGLFRYNTGETILKQANLTSQINGERQVFTIPDQFVGGSVRLYYNGVRQVAGETYTESNDTQISLQFTPQVGDFLTCDYAT